LIKDESGLALPLVIVVVISLSLIGIILYNYNMAETTQVARDEDNLKAHYIARSGAHAVASYLKGNIDDAQALIDAGESERVDFAGGDYRVEIYAGSNFGDNEEDMIYIKSTGTYGNAVQGILLSIKMEGVTSALITGGFYDETGVAFNPADRIKGDVTYTGEVDLGDEFIEDLKEDVIEDGDFYEQYFDYEKVISPCKDDELEMFVACPDYPSYSDPNASDDISKTTGGTRHLDVNASISYNDINITNGTMEIDPSGDHLLLKANNMNLHNSDITVKLSNDNVVAIVVENDYKHKGDFIIQSADEKGGYLLLYVKNYNEGGDGGSEFKYKDEQGEEILGEELNVHVNVYVFEGGNFDMTGSPYFEGAVYAPEANSVLTGTSTIKGWIFTDQVQFDGGADIEYSDIDIRSTSMELQFLSTDTWRYDE